MSNQSCRTPPRGPCIKFWQRAFRSKLVADLHRQPGQHVKEDTSLKPKGSCQGGGLPLLEAPVVKNISFRGSYHPQYPVCPMWCWASLVGVRNQRHSSSFFDCWMDWTLESILQSWEDLALANMSFLRNWLATPGGRNMITHQGLSGLLRLKFLI